MAADTIKVLVVDDTILYRKVVADILASIPDVCVVGTAADGRIATWRIENLRPDLVILDVEMPHLDGLQVLQFIRQKGLPTSAIMLSSLTQAGSRQTIEALELGAFDFIPKPQTSSFEQSRQAIQRDLTRAIEAFIRHRALRQATDRTAQVVTPGQAMPSATVVKPRPPFQRTSTMVLIGVSTGGPSALKYLLPRLPGELGVPILLVQHMPPVFTRSLAASLDGQCELTVMEAQDGQPVEPNQVFVAPGGKQMGIRLGSKDGPYLIAITDDPPENG
ncbi:MAG: chemotaxis protein CheB, partial [Sedimentisphaerales bacterium]|nr:chemotaxis protein CheB [Sedimentisphaerales bacterium]